MSDDSRFQRAVQTFDALNAAAPNQELVSGVPRPKLVAEADRLTHWIEKLVPNASEALRLAARCQHLERFKIPRSAYPEGKAGYHAWRTALGRYHAERAGAVLEELGYDEATRERVKRINLKLGIKRDPEVQAMEDALCLAFLESEAASFAKKHDPEKVIQILQKTWAKMSEAGHAEALKLPMPEEFRALVERALAPT
jgi:hypothetical protein